MAKQTQNILFRVHVIENIFKKVTSDEYSPETNFKLRDFLDRDISDTDFAKIVISNNLDANLVITALDNLRKTNSSTNWRSSISKETRANYESFVNESVSKFKDLVKKLVDGNRTDLVPVKELSSHVLKIDNFSTKLDSFSNTLSIELDIQKSISGIPIREEDRKLLFSLSENDIVILSYKLLGEKVFKIRFMGFVTTTKFVEHHGTISHKILNCEGISKVLGLSSIPVDPSVASFQTVTQLGSGESAPPVFTNNFSDKNAFDVFKLILNNILFATEQRDVQVQIKNNSELKKIIQNAEAQKNLVVKINEQLKEFLLRESAGTFAVESQLPNDPPSFFSAQKKKDYKTLVRSKEEAISKFVTDISQISTDLLPKDLKLFVPQTFEGPLTPNMVRVENINDVTELYLSDTITQIKAILVKDISTTDNILNFLFNSSEITKALVEEKREAHINYPLILTYGLGLARIRQDNDLQFLDGVVDPLIGQFDKRIADSKPFDTLLKEGQFRTFYSEFNTPEQILDGLRQNLFLDFFEDRPGRVICRNPKYNDWPNDDTSSNFIIERENVMSIDLSRNDTALKSRADYKIFTPTIGEQQFTNANYVDVDVTLKYGFRPDTPRHNPNATTSDSAAVFATLDLIKTNSKSRVLNLQVKNNRDYQLGNLYFIPEIGFSEAELTTFTNTDRKTIVSQLNSSNLRGQIQESQVRLGKAAYLIEMTTNIQYGSVSTHTLTFSFVRDAVQVGNFLNFREIPNLLTALTIIEENNVIPSNNVINEILNQNKTSSLVCGQYIADTNDPGVEKYIALTREASNNVKALITKGATQEQVDAELARLAREQVGVISGFKKSSFQGAPCVLAPLLNSLTFLDVYLTIPANDLNLYKRLEVYGLSPLKDEQRVKRAYNNLNHNTSAIEQALKDEGFEPLTKIVNKPQIKIDFSKMGVKALPRPVLLDKTINLALPNVGNGTTLGTQILSGGSLFRATSSVGTLAKGTSGGLIFDIPDVTGKPYITKTFVKFPTITAGGRFDEIEVVNISIPVGKQISISNFINKSPMLLNQKGKIDSFKSGTQTVSVDTTPTVYDILNFLTVPLELYSSDDVKETIQFYIVKIDKDLRDTTLSDDIGIREILGQDQFSVIHPNVIPNILKTGKDNTIRVPIINDGQVRNSIKLKVSSSFSKKFIDAVNAEFVLSKGITGKSSSLSVEKFTTLSKNIHDSLYELPDLDLFPIEQIHPADVIEKKILLGLVTEEALSAASAFIKGNKE